MYNLVAGFPKHEWDCLVAAHIDLESSAILTPELSRPFPRAVVIDAPNLIQDVVVSRSQKRRSRRQPKHDLIVQKFVEKVGKGLPFQLADRFVSNEQREKEEQ